MLRISISDSIGKGLSFIDTNGAVHITDSIFRNNTINTPRNPAASGGIYIEFTECTPGVVNCSSADNHFNKGSVYGIKDCKFKFNDARYFGTDPSIDLTARTYVTLGNGGGILIFIFGQALNNIFLH